jgi:hypothetical protein
MNQIRSSLLISGFLLLALLTSINKIGLVAKAQSTGAVQSLVVTTEVDLASLAGPNHTMVVSKTPELHALDNSISLHDQLAIAHGISLTYKSKGIDPTENNLVVQSRSKDGTITQIGPEKWLQVSARTYNLGPEFFPDAVEVTNLAATNPISWEGVEGIWVVNATNTGVTLVTPRQNITTAVSVGKVITDGITGTATFTFTVRATPKLAARWSDDFSTQFTVYNGCPEAVWPQKLSGRQRFSITVPISELTATGTVTWAIHHVDGSGLQLATGFVKSPLCGNFTPIELQELYVPVLYRNLVSGE